MLNFGDFIQVFVFTTNHHLKEYFDGTLALFQHAANCIITTKTVSEGRKTYICLCLN